MASVVLAGGRDPLVRNVYLRDDPRDEAVRVYVAGQVATVLRFEQPCDPARTRMLAWEGRFEPVVCAGKAVLLVPLQSLDPEERFILLVTLVDGEEVPFTVSGTQGEEERWPDQQVNVFLAPDSRDALQKQLEDSQARERRLLEEVRRRAREDTGDHALAKLLATGAIHQTSFVPRKKRLVKTEEGTEMVVHIFAGKAKAAVLFTVTNHHPSKPWSLLEARLRTPRPGQDQRPPFLFGEERPFALRRSQNEIAPGQCGTVAVVVDKAAFMTNDGLVNTLALELYRHDGAMDTHVLLDRRLLHE